MLGNKREKIDVNKTCSNSIVFFQEEINGHDLPVSLQINETVTSIWV